jgi:hypothetical protein
MNIGNDDTNRDAAQNLLNTALESLEPLETLFKQAEKQNLIGPNINYQITARDLRRGAYAAADIRAHLNTSPTALPSGSDFKSFMAWANAAGYDTAYTHDGTKWVYLNPTTADLWQVWIDLCKAWRAALRKKGEAL